LIKGLVQGVGFRPFICRLAALHGLYGEVDNRTNGVSVIVQGDSKTIDRFSNDILEKAPPASQIKSIEVLSKPVENYSRFSIAPSKAADDQITEISPDIAVCPDCLEELSTDHGRFNYPFINCTNCGPRFTIIEGLPYDRPNTTMKNFTMCEKCGSEYTDISDRRFHAQPIACNSCGPEYLYRSAGKTVRGIDNILREICSDVDSGRSVAIKGIGGYFLLCDALNNEAVAGLRIRKQRDSKPFAVMFRDIDEVKKYCCLSRAEEDELCSWRRPILILKEKKPLAESVSNGLNTIGAMLPYMPFHYLLFKKLSTPVVVLTSGNFAGEPIITDDAEAERELMNTASSVVSYNRKIHNRADDSVIRIINNSTSIIRRSRGFTPRPVDLIFNVEGILALGPEQKNTFCIGKGFQAVMSQYIGDLKNAPACDFYEEAINRFSSLFRFRPSYLACDLHPDYFSTSFASALSKKYDIPVAGIQHHHAHIVSCMAENNLDENVIGISMDGTGYGTDGNIWGGEFLISDAEYFSRIAHFDYVPVPGGDRAVEEPWRMAFSYLYKYFGDDNDFYSLPCFRTVDIDKIGLIREMINKGMNVPLSSSAGRLFDAVSAILGLCSRSTFDSEAPIRLESIINCSTEDYYPFNFENNIISFADTFKGILNDLPVLDASVISARFHNTVAEVILHISKMMRKKFSVNKVVLSGGVFQNKYLMEKSAAKLLHEGFRVYSNHLVPSNDGGVSLGQLVVASKTFGLCV
jgi:hydrogenase maturation protein HypF